MFFSSPSVWLYLGSFFGLLTSFTHSVLWRKERWDAASLAVFAVCVLVPYLNTFFLLIYLRNAWRNNRRSSS